MTAARLVQYLNAEKQNGVKGIFGTLLRPEAIPELKFNEENSEVSFAIALGYQYVIDRFCAQLCHAVEKRENLRGLDVWKTGPKNYVDKAKAPVVITIDATQIEIRFITKQMEPFRKGPAPLPGAATPISSTSTAVVSRPLAAPSPAKSVSSTASLFSSQTIGSATPAKSVSTAATASSYRTEENKTATSALATLSSIARSLPETKSDINTKHPVIRQARFLTEVRKTEWLDSSHVISYLFLSMLAGAQKGQFHIQFYGDLEKELEAKHAEGINRGSFMTFKTLTTAREYCIPGTDYYGETTIANFGMNLKNWLKCFALNCKRQQIELPTDLMFLIPINCGASHWIGAAVRFQNPNQALLKEGEMLLMQAEQSFYQSTQISIYDSLPFATGKRVPFDAIHIAVPRQPNGYECGVLTVRNLLNSVMGTTQRNASEMYTLGLREIENLTKTFKSLADFRDAILKGIHSHRIVASQALETSMTSSQPQLTRPSC